MSDLIMAEPGTGSCQRSTLLIVSGLPATGKTTLARLLQRELGWPLFTKDGLKERMYDVAFASTDRPFDAATSMMLGQMSIALLVDIAQELAATGMDAIIESNFRPDLAVTDLAPLLDVADLRQVHCTAPRDVILGRYRARPVDGSRHLVHLDDEAIVRLVDQLDAGINRPIPFDAPVLSVDTSDGYEPDLQTIVAFATQRSRHTGDQRGGEFGSADDVDTLDIAPMSPDAPDAARLIRELSHETAARYGFMDDGSGGFSAADVKEPGSVFLVGRIESEAVACGAVRPLESGVAEVKRMYVKPPFRGRGLAKKMLGALEQFATETGYDAVWIATGSRHPEALRLYERSGYRRIPNYGPYIGDARSVCFEKALRPMDSDR